MTRTLYPRTRHSASRPNERFSRRGFPSPHLSIPSSQRQGCPGWLQSTPPKGRPRELGDDVRKFSHLVAFAQCSLQHTPLKSVHETTRAKSVIGAPRADPRSYCCQECLRQYCNIGENVRGTGREFHLMYAVMLRPILSLRFSLPMISHPFFEKNLCPLRHCVTC